MKPSTIYSWQPISVTNDLWGIDYFAEMENILIQDLDHEEVEKQKRVELKHYVDHCEDGERVNYLFSVWFDNKPVMICEFGGRGGRDCREKYVTDKDGYVKMFDFMRSLMVVDTDNLTDDLYDAEDDLEALNNVYGVNIFDLYDPNLKPTYQEGDIVLASVLYDHLRMAYGQNVKYVETRCRVINVNPFNPTYTYQLAQLDRRWETHKEIEERLGKEAAKTTFVGEMVDDPGKGGLGARGNDKTIIKLLERKSDD